MTRKFYYHDPLLPDWGQKYVGQDSPPEMSQNEKWLAYKSLPPLFDNRLRPLMASEVALHVRRRYMLSTSHAEYKQSHLLTHTPAHR